MNVATRCGQDADCNPANAAGILGTILGAKRIPAEYREPLHNTYWNKTLKGLPDSYEIDALARDTALVGMEVVLKHGGEMVTRDGNWEGLSLQARSACGASASGTIKLTACSTGKRLSSRRRMTERKSPGCAFRAPSTSNSFCTNNFDS